MKHRSLNLTHQQRIEIAHSLRKLRQFGLMRPARERHLMARLARERVEAYEIGLSMIADRSTSKVKDLLDRLQCRDIMRMMRRGELR